ncbi:FKBP-type peptidyl-prolyl cis-trans isomerase [Mucilaginibacter myungsuensis]|uniref:Peptidyl-prolyl cis-trans isomerase n=1 Tax=Mucilaginibacter myungsuensis TaxID=649104 RepID=A0A929PVR6_9SPHI|nr:FKBP-type peptidyl-prolyl cis-trans isomerase [Mucilaginibacter myungsuensis]MBE9661399.1 FKBP-type peptidyl-prolyl cis-trans isomerase [Mucilaginibacter myungsuensis]MDN3597542.1 FKBP-type peptidyl-prolyl cis-trans isomerase [Mucilaginibacter myungsuensis]
MKRNLILLAIAAIGLSSCGGGFKQGPGGMLYNIHEDKSGPVAKDGDFVAINLIATTEGDSSLNNTYDHGMPIATILQKPQYKGDIVAGLNMLSEGDSATFKINIDSTSQKGAQKPPFKGKYIIFKVKLEKVIAKGNLTDQVFQDRCKAYYDGLITKVKASEPAKIEKYIADNKITATKTASGLRYFVTKASQGAMPVAGDTVLVNYTGRIMGQKDHFETTVKEVAMTVKKSFNPNNPYKPVPFAIGVKRVIPGWDEGVLLMHKGEKTTFIIPSALAYGEQGMMPVIPPFSTLVFDLELVDIIKPNPNAKPAAPSLEPPVR